MDPSEQHRDGPPGDAPSQGEEGRTWRLEAHASDEARVYQAGRDQHIHYRDGLRERRRAVAGTVVDECPYPGLTAFGREQAHWFFGRDELVADLIDDLGRRLRTGGLQMVIGPSGAGKSSVLRAGLLPGLEQGLLPGSARWPQVVFTPAAAPLRALADRLAPLLAEPTDASPSQVADLLAADPPRCVEMLDRVLATADGTDAERLLVIVVDQFEELFTLCPDDAQRRAFIDLLIRLAEAPTGAFARRSPLALVVIGIRADFYAACTDYPQLRPALQDPLVVTGMSQEQLREAIVYPAQAVGLDIEEGLTEILLRDLGTASATGEGKAAGYEAGRLPLLAYALQRSWQQRHGSTLTVQGYQSTGGIERAIATTAERVFTGLDDAEKDMARLLFLRLVTIGDGTEDTRRRLSRVEMLESGVDRRTAMAVIDAFTRERLLTQQQDTIEITHEALIRGWPRLRSWIEADRSSLLVRQQLAEDAAAWRHHGEDDAYLYADSRLAAAQSLESGPQKAALTPTERGFLAASVRRSRRRARRAHQVIATLTALFLVAAVTGVFALLQNKKVTQQRNEALSRQAAEAATRVDDSSLAAQLSLSAYRIAPTPEARGALLANLTHPVGARLLGHSGALDWITYRSDGRALATVASDTTARLWDVSDPARPRSAGVARGHTASVVSAAFSPDGRLLATSAVDTTARLWDVSDLSRPRELATLRGHTSDVKSVVFSPDGNTLATASHDRTVRLWDISDVRAPQQVGIVRHDDGLPKVAFSPDGRMIAIASYNGVARLVNLSDPRNPKNVATLKGHQDGVISVAFAPNGRLLATASADATLRLWEVSHPTRARYLGTARGHEDFIYDVAFSPNGRTLASASTDRTARLWDIADPARPRQLTTLTGFTNTVTGVAFSPNARVLATSSADGTARMWNISDPARVSVRANLAGHTDAVLDTAISHHGSLLATASSDRTVKLWDLSDPARAKALSTMKGHSDSVRGVVFGPDDRIVVTVSGDQTGRLWDVSTPTRPVPLAQLKGHINIVHSAAFSPGGRVVVTTGRDGATLVWDVSQPRRPKRLSMLGVPDNWANAAAFSPDGRIVAVGSGASTVALWDVSDPARPTPPAVLKGHTNSVSDVRFSPDGALLATSANDGTAQLWDVSHPSHTKRISILRGHSDSVDGVAFSPDGRTLATGSADSTVRIWKISNPAQPELWATLISPEWVSDTEFSPDGKVLGSASGDATAQLWSMDVETAKKYVCSASGMAITRTEWSQYIPDLPYDPPCGA
ncbi:AAA family ATPase [Actinocorallia sp. B10E7]|uniref:nSTAND1 domain-containing NTPase n=1 Tax=Actinocorallia sp. B10E7 TaxID=3153558 RepID=UPI00325E8440